MTKQELQTLLGVAFILAIPFVPIGTGGLIGSALAGSTMNSMSPGSHNTGLGTPITGNSGGGWWRSTSSLPSTNRTDSFGSAARGTSGISSVTGTHEGPIRK